MKILITGAHGFVATNFIHHLFRAGRSEVKRVVALDDCANKGTGDNLAAFEQLDQLVEIKGELGDYALISRLLHEHQIDAVVNFTSASSVDRSIDSPEGCFQNNVMDVVRLLEACRHYHKAQWGAKRENFRVLQISCAKVLGSLPTRGSAFTEVAPLAPSSPYAASKAAGDCAVRSYFRTFGLPVVTARCSQGYGPYQFPDKLIPRTIINALREERLGLYGDGGERRDWVHVSDQCRAIWGVLRGGRVGEVYHVGGGGERTNLEVVDAICNVLQSMLKPRQTRHFRGLKTLVPERPGHDRRCAVDCTKIERELGWHPRVRFADGIRDTVEWYLNHAPWWQKLIGMRDSGAGLGSAA